MSDLIARPAVTLNTGLVPLPATPTRPYTPGRVGLAVPGPQGPPGPAGVGGAIVHTQASPLATWTIPHTLGRRPAVAVYLDSGEEVEADVTVSNVSVTVTFASPVSGVALLT